MSERVANYFRFNPTGALSVDWYIGKRCNFDCSYCVEYLHDYTSPHVPFDKMKTLVDMIYEKHGTNVYWSLTGGEPTINPDFMKLCKYIKEEKGARFISLTTNGSRTLKYHKELFQYLDGITLSFHFEFMKNRIDEYVHKCIELEKYKNEFNKRMTETHEKFPDPDNCLNKKNLILRFMVEKSSHQEIKYMQEKFKEAGVQEIEHRQIRPPLGRYSELMPDKKVSYDLVEPETPEEYVNDLEKVKKLKKVAKSIDDFYDAKDKDAINKEYFSKMPNKKKKLSQWIEDKDGNLEEVHRHYNEAIWKKDTNFKGWLCWAGIKHIKIAPNGDIFIGSCHLGGKRGNIYEPEKIDLPKEPIRCTKSVCHDNTDLKTPKIKDWKYYHLIKDMIEWKK